jgi:hypothetical protein
MTTAELPSRQVTTAIGSLPHHNIDAALEFSFQLDIPFLPQIPIRNPWEFMIAQALEGIPGLIAEKDGSVRLDIDVWNGRGRVLDERLLAAFSGMAAREDAFESFEPTAATSSSWHPFLWELEERGTKLAKVQIAGPMTAQWAVKLSDGSSIAKHADVSSQVYRLVLARALAMTRRLRKGGIQPLIYLDEPGLYGFTASEPRHALALQELRILIKALQQDGAIVGLHCCSNTDWSAVFSLGLNVISIDTALSLPQLLAKRTESQSFVESGGRFSLGLIPTSREPHQELGSLKSKALLAGVAETFAVAWNGQRALVEKALSRAIFTPACGLALHSVSDAEAVLALLLELTPTGR